MPAAKSTMRKHKTKNNLWTNLKQNGLLTFFLKNKDNIMSLNGLKVTPKSLTIEAKRVENVISLIYKLFLYSIFGVFIKLLNKLFKI